jgi:DNA-binding SARP family transcriptional activator/LysM repeat protein
MTTARRAAAGLGAFAVLASLLVGVPLALMLIVGWPLPHSLPTVDEVRTLLATSGIPDVVLIDTLAVICWIAWLDFALATVVELGATIAGRAASRPLIARPWQALVARLITTVVVAVVVIGSRPQSSTPPRGATLTGALARRPTSQPPGAVTVAHRVAAPAQVPAPTSDRYVVRRGDTLWGIAGQRLRNPTRWPSIWRDNADRSEPDGRRFTDPDLIVPGWTLEVPTATTKGTGAPAPRQTPASGSTSPGGIIPTPTPTGDVSPPPSSTPSPVEKPVATMPPTHAPVARPNARPEVGPSGVTLPSGGLVGGGFAAGVIAGLAAARLHERRRRRVGSAQTSAVNRLVGPTVRHLRHAIAPPRAPEQDGDNPQGPTPPDASEESTRLSVAGPLAAGVTEDGDTVTIIDVDDLSGRSITGEGAEGVGRALVTAAVVEPSLDGANLVVVGQAQRLVGGMGSIPGIEGIDSLPAALTRLHAECERRERVLRWQGVSDYRSIASSSDPLGALLAVVDGADVGAAASRVKAVTDRGRRLGISLAVIGEAPGFEPLEIAADGTIGAETGASVTERLFTVGNAEAGELLALGSASRGGAVDAAAPPAPAEEVQGPAPTVAAPSPPSDRAVPVDLRLFGPARVLTNGAELTTGLRAAARELMVLLAVHRSGLRQEEALAEMWPDDEDEHLDTFRVAVTSTRRRLRELCGAEGQYIALIGNRYVLDPGTVDCDLWRFDAAAARAAHEPEADRRRQALIAAAELVAGEPLAGASFEWAEPVRENLRRRAIDVLGELGAILGAEGNLAGAVDTLDRARAVDPYCEDVYRRLMGYLADMGRDDVALRVYRELEKYVAQLGAEPDEQTEELMVALRHRAAIARPASSPRNTPLNRSSSDDPDKPNGDADTGFAARTKVVRRRQLWQ